MKPVFGRWLALAGLAALAGCQTAQAPCVDNCAAGFVDPVAGEEILDRAPHGTIEVTIGGGDVPLDIGEVTAARLEFAREGDETWTPVEVESAIVGSSMVPPDAVSMLVHGVPAGSLRLRAQFRGPDGILYQAAPTPVTILRSPRPRGRVTRAGPSPGGGTGFDVDFDGSGSTDGAGRASGVTEWEWDFGDGTPKKKGKTLRHSYARQGTYMVTLCVKDAKGNRSYKYYSVNTRHATSPPPTTLLSGELPEYQDCKCTRMTIDQRWGAPFGAGYRNSAGVKGPVNKVRNTPGGPYRFMYFGFEVIADIVGNPDKCYEWQEIQRTSVDLSGKVSYFNGIPAYRKNRPPPHEDDRKILRKGKLPKGTERFPQLSTLDKFGVDGYEKTGPTKLHLPGVIRWKDRPGQPGGVVASAMQQSQVGYKYNAIFNTFVGGPKGNSDRTRECSCRFRLSLEVLPSGTTQNAKLAGVTVPGNPPRLHPEHNKCVYKH